MNTVLMSPMFGPRLLLSGVVTGRPVTDFPGMGAVAGEEPGAEVGLGRRGESGMESARRIEGETATRAGTGAGPGPSLHCTMCGHCAKVCPGNAIGPEGVDLFRCRTISAVIPSLLIPAVKWMLGRRMLLSAMAPLAPLIARTATIRCSRCVTECPNFEGAERDPAGKSTENPPP
jgi:Pyruvate/2-oxoacid:ferredoxin oxidoreductase delta subunit